jgi:3-oxoacyl-[acyl-carrier-protein] synthase-1/3-oxoacyl-[acyl-carrier-protein] synthase II
VTVTRVFVVGMGLMTPLGKGVADNIEALRQGRCGLKALSLFDCPFEEPLPVGEVAAFTMEGPLPRTHQLALAAAREAMAACDDPPDAVIMGITTGGMLSTEVHLKKGKRVPPSSPYHAAGSVTDVIAREVGCRGPVLTVSTACSSGAVAIKLAHAMLRRGQVRRVLAGGADSLCRLTYYGFNSLQIVDRRGARPLDRERRGMTVSEGAALLLLEAAATPPEGAVAQVLGGGLTCDAHHPAAPHPEGRGALAAMQAALADAGLTPDQIDYVNLHGTGTVENDLSEARAVQTLFGARRPPVSSIKGSLGHSLAASGAIEAVAAALAIRDAFLPGNVGFQTPDPAIGIEPLAQPRPQAVSTILSNSFGFGGNNAALVLADPGQSGGVAAEHPRQVFQVRRFASLCGAGDTGAMLARLEKGEACKGILDAGALIGDIPPRSVRRMKRLARMAVGLAARAIANDPDEPAVHGVFMGTGWGALSETHDFLDKLYASNEFFTSPIDFVGSVHNAPAGQVAIREKIEGPNVTMTGGDASFEQALLAAAHLGADGRPVLVGGADEHHPIFSALFDPSTSMDDTPSDGGGMVLLQADDAPGLTLAPGFMGVNDGTDAMVDALIDDLGGAAAFSRRFGALLVGIPAALRETAERQQARLIELTGFDGPVVDYRRFTGEFATASALAAVAALDLVDKGQVPGALHGGATVSLTPRSVLIVGLGNCITAMVAAVR